MVPGADGTRETLGPGETMLGLVATQGWMALGAMATQGQIAREPGATQRLMALG